MQNPHFCEDLLPVRYASFDLKERAKNIFRQRGIEVTNEWLLQDRNMRDFADVILLIGKPIILK